MIQMYKWESLELTWTHTLWAGKINNTLSANEQAKLNRSGIRTSARQRQLLFVLLDRQTMTLSSKKQVTSWSYIIINNLFHTFSITMKLAYLSIKYIYSMKMHEITIKGLHTFHQKCKVHPSRPTNTRLDHDITKYKRNLESRSYVFSEKLPLVTYMKRNIVCTDMPSVFILAYCGLSTEPASGGMYNELFLLSG